MGGVALEQSIRRLREETDAQLIDNLRHTIAIVLVVLAVLALGDIRLHSAQLNPLYLHKLLLVFAGMVALVVLRLPRTRRWSRSIGVLFLGATAVSCGAQGAIAGDAVMPAPLLMTLTIGTAAMLPWGALPHAVLALTAALSVVINGYVVTGSWAGALGSPLLMAVLSAFGASVYLAHFFEQQRVVYAQQGIRLASEAGRVGEERFVGANDGLWDWSVEFGDAYYSARWKDMLGATVDEIAPRFEEWRRRVHPDDAARFEADLLAHLTGASPRFENEHRLRRQDGSYCWVMARGLAIRTKDGRALRVAGSLTDISERKRIEAALRESETKYKEMIENLNDVVFAVDVDGRYTYISPVIESIAGYRPEDLLGRSQFDLIRSDDIRHVRETFQRTMSGGLAEPEECRMQTKSGAWLWVRCNARRSVIDGTLVGLRGTLTDISGRKQAEAQARLQSVALESAANGIVITNRAGVIEWVNPAFTALSGYSREEAVGQHTRLLKSGAHPPAYYEDMWRTILSGGIWQGQTINRRRNGSLYTEEQMIAPVRDRDGDIKHFFAIKQDVTDRKAAENLRESLVRMMVHDLRQPLSIILGAVDLLRDPGGTDDKRWVIGAIERAVSGLLELVNSILECEQLKSGQLPIECTRFAVGALIDHVVQGQAPLATQKRQALTAECQDGLPPAYADRRLIGRALQNLIGNAIKFTPEDGTIRVRAVADGGRIVVSVQDTGPGIPDELRARLFREFAPGSHRNRGSGLGLAFCRLAVEANGGGLWVESEPGRGATFSFSLPVVATTA
jgi:PAS domain S-box-containing protein